MITNLSAFYAVCVTPSAILFKPQTLLQFEEDIHILNRLAGRAFYQIVNGRKANDFALHTSYKDMAIVCPCDIFNSRSAIAYLHKRFSFIKIVIEL